MNIIALVLILLSAFLHSIREFLTKLGKDKHSFIYLYRIAGIILFFPVFVYCIMRYPMNRYGLILAVISGFVHCFYYIGLGETLKSGDMSVVYPITRCTPFILVFWSYFISHEHMTFLGVVGIILITIGTISIQIDRNNFRNSLHSIFRFKNYAVKIAWVVAIITAIYSVIDSKGVFYINAFTYLYITYFVSILFHMIFIFKTSSKETLLFEWRSNRLNIILAGFVSLFGYLLVLMAFKIENVTYVVAIRQASVIFGVLLGAYVLNEGNKLARISSSLVIYAGIYLVTCFG
jgi:EamA-like transporter family.